MAAALSHKVHIVVVLPVAAALMPEGMLAGKR
jgi:hypothetical protein